MMGTWLQAGEFIAILTGGGRMAMVNATGGHFAAAVAATRLRRRRFGRVELLPVDTQLPEMVARLNLFRPAILASYASTAAMLAGE